MKVTGTSVLCQVHHWFIVGASRPALWWHTGSPKRPSTQRSTRDCRKWPLERSWKDLAPKVVWARLQSICDCTLPLLIPAIVQTAKSARGAAKGWGVGMGNMHALGAALSLLKEWCERDPAQEIWSLAAVWQCLHSDASPLSSFGLVY